MRDIEWFCDIYGLKLHFYQKVIMLIVGGGTFRRMRKAVIGMSIYMRGYRQALEDINSTNNYKRGDAYETN